MLLELRDAIQRRSARRSKEIATELERAAWPGDQSERAEHLVRLVRRYKYKDALPTDRNGDGFRELVGWLGSDELFFADPD